MNKQAINPNLPLTLTREKVDQGVHEYRSALARHAMTRRVEAGECPGVAPLGYRNVFRDGRRTVEVDATVAPLIREAFHMAGQKNSSLRKILAELHPRGFVGHAGRPMSIASLAVLLKNPFYYGLIRLRGQLHRGNHMPLVSKTLFDRVQCRLFRRRCR